MYDIFKKGAFCFLVHLPYVAEYNTFLKLYAKLYATEFYKNKKKQREIIKVGRSVARCPKPR
jgi:hypothetical protein